MNSAQAGHDPFRRLIGVGIVEEEYALLTRQLAGALYPQNAEATAWYDNLSLEVRSPAMRAAVDVLYRVAQTDATVMLLDESLWGELMSHDWPGNVRELENFLERRWLAASDGAARVGEYDTKTGKPANALDQQPSAALSLSDALAQTERDYLTRAMRGTRSTYEMADRLQISQASVVRKLKKHGMTLMRG